jgi:hypothetical protein
MKYNETEYNIDTLLLVIDQAKEKYEDLENYQMVSKLNAVLNFLPDYPVMAVLEAEYYQLPKDFIKILKDTFKVKSFK